MLRICLFLARLEFLRKTGCVPHYFQYKRGHLIFLPKNVKSQMIDYQILNFNICRTLLAVVAEHGFLSPQFLTLSLMRVPIRSFGETNSALLRTRNATYWYIPGCDEQYRAPRTSSIHGSSSANIRNIIVSRDSPCTYTHTCRDLLEKAPSTSSIHNSSSSANIRKVWSNCSIRGIPLPCSTRRAVVL